MSFKYAMILYLSIILFGVLLICFMLPSKAHADCWKVGECEAKNYQDTFNVDQCSDLTELTELAKANRGFIVKEKDKEEYSVIYSKNTPAPNTQYIHCTKGTYED